LDPILGGIVVAIATVMGGMGVAGTVIDRRALGRVWLRAAREAGLEDLTVRWLGFWPRSVDGQRGTFRVRIEAGSNHAESGVATRISVHGLSPDLEIRPEVPSPVPQALRWRDIELGDEAFDDAMVVTGQPLLATAVLGADLRRRIPALFAPRREPKTGDHSAVVEKGLRLERGQLMGERVVGDQPEWIAAFVRDLLSVAEALLPPDDLAPRLLANVRDDPQPPVRRNSLLMLVREFAGHSATREALRLARVDGDEGVQLEAAIGLGSEGRATLVEIATRDWTGDACAARAVTELRSALPVDTARAILARALRTRRLQTAAACVESLSRRGPEQADVISRVLGVEEGALAVAAARGLGRIGSSSSVVSLREAEARLPRDADLRRAVRESIAAIQSRMGEAEGGRVSLAAEPGRVTLTSEAVGRVTLPDGEAE
jgi:hypothetical protein